MYLRLRMRCLAAMGVVACNHHEPTSITTTTNATASVDVPTGASRHMPSCPSGTFCVSQPATIPADAGAPAPYGMCAATTTPPADAGINPGVYVSFDPDGTKQARATAPRACCYHWNQLCGGGRAYRDDDGEPRVAAAIERSDWLLEGASSRGEARHRDHWAREAAFEHASIASFAQLTLDLLAVGAPPHLIEATQRAALDEIKHARIAYSLASDDRRIGPGRLEVLPRPPATLQSIVRDAIVDGCIGEVAAAIDLRKQALATPDAKLRALLEEMADDEERHAELAYATVAWAVAVEPRLAEVVREELATARASGRHTRVVEQIAEPCLSRLLA